MAWQVEAGERMCGLLLALTDVARVEYKGSMLDMSSIDQFSDVDICIYLADGYQIDFTNSLEAIFQLLGNIFAYEVHRGEKQDTVRLCFDNGNRFDLSVIYPTPNHYNDDHDHSKSLDRKVNEFWFAAIMAVVKLGRKDNLIAAHLALELYQLTIVIQMLIRDFNKNTNIHRFGDSELVPAIDVLTTSISHINNENMLSAESKITEFIFAATRFMDEMMPTVCKDYKPRNRTFHWICTNCLSINP